MGKWAVKDGDDEVFIVESRPDGTVSLRIPPADPLIVSRARAEKIRTFIAAAVLDTRPGAPS